MPTRAIKFRLIVPRDSSENSSRARKALWATHSFVNEAVKMYETLLLEMRQDDVCQLDSEGEEATTRGDHWKELLATRLRGRGHSDEVVLQALPLFKDLYARIVKSSVKAGSGTAKEGRAYHSALVDADSQAGLAKKQRFDAMSRAPGIRCRAASADDVAQLKNEPEGWLARRLNDLGKVDVSKIEPGDLLPIGGGELLVAPAQTEKGKTLSVRHADINAAQNLSRRFLEAYDPPLRIVAFRVPGDEEVFVNANLGKRVAAALAAKVAILHLRPGANILFELESYPTKREAAKKLNVKTRALNALSEQDDKAAEGDDLDLEVEAARDLEASLSKDRKTFFRDPSGVIFSGRWVESMLFWSQVKTQVLKRLRASGRFHG
jgi:hypothetical protein